MNRFKRAIAKAFFPELITNTRQLEDKSTGGQRELASEVVKAVVYKTTDSTDFEEPDFSMETIETAYDSDSYIRQGVDKYVDQIFKEGYSFYGNDTAMVEYINLRLAYIAEATGIPTYQFLIDIAEDIVKYGNCMIVKARTNDVNALPQGVNVQGLMGKDAIAGYFCANPSTMTVLRDEYGTVTKWKQKTDKGEQEFDPQDVLHFYYKRKKGNAFGTSILIPVLNDVKALRDAEENVLRMMWRGVYPIQHVKVGTEDAPATDAEVDRVTETIEDSEIDANLVTSERVEVKPIIADKVINAEPYLRYFEQRVFSGLGIPEIMFGRGDTANRSTGDNMTSEMADRIRAMSRTIEIFFNEFIVKELLMEGGYDILLNPDQKVEFRFNDNDVDVKIKKEVHAIYKYEHSAITEDEMRELLGMDPIADSDREKMFVELITRENMRIEAQTKNTETGTGTKETNNKQKNSGGRPKSKDYNFIMGLIKDQIDSMNDEIENYILNCYNTNRQVLQKDTETIVLKYSKQINYLSAKENVDISDTIARCSLRLCNNIHNNFLRVNSIDTVENVNDFVNIQLDIFKKTVINSYVNYYVNY